MGEVVGAGLLAHVPTIMLPEETRRELNRGPDFTLVQGLRDLRSDVFESVDYDTVVVLDSHWFTTVEFVVTAQDRRAGLFTAEELPRGMCRIPYDFRGDPELAHLLAAEEKAHSTWISPDRRPVPAAVLRHGQHVEVPRRGHGQALDLAQRGADRRDGGLPPRRPRPGRRDRQERPQGAADRLRRAVAHLLEAAPAPRPRVRRASSTSTRPRRTPRTWSGSRGSRMATTAACWRRCRSSCATARSRCSPTT